ncbi:sodium:proton exchanger [Mycobacterium heidelbergense]|uniref:Sodium:proton exchanger n=1 Tax=Mycobacterium heidelbergense TaxID=53376 RepID=A0A1X0DTC8_MYCHE|nr:sodium:proton exchanger [Mycobacterium heidelbergense]BBZ50166.1 sodium/calcium exchanger family protein [Mycobacterium heidelbergense]
MLATDGPVATTSTRARARRLTLIRSALITATFIAPAMGVRIAGPRLDPVAALLVFGAAVVAASFLLAWAAEAAQIDVSGGLAIAVLALVAVLPEYAVDLYYAYVSGHNADYTQYAAANMTGSNRLLMGLGWPVVVLVSIVVARKAGAGKPAGLALEPANRVELGFLLIAGVVAFVIPASGEIHLALGLALLAWFGFYLYKVGHGEVEEPELIGTAAALGELPDRGRRVAVVGLFVASGAVILLCAKPFADNLVAAGTELGVDRFLLVQWLAPLASEAPEFIIAVIFATRGKGTAAIATLISSKVNQWTLLIGSLPVAHLLGGGGSSLALDSRQIEEVLLTATQTLMGVALILGLRFRRAAAWALLGLFVVQFPMVSTHGRLALCGIYTAVAAAGLISNRRYLIATVRAPFVGTAIRHGGHPHAEDGA